MCSLFTRTGVLIPLTLDEGDNGMGISYSALLNGIHAVAGSGSGKSRLLGRLLAFQFLVSGIPLVILDPSGDTIDNLLDQVARLGEKGERFTERIIVVDMAGLNGQVIT